MDNLLFYALLGLITYYFFYHLPNQKTRPDPQPTAHSKSTQTEPTIPERTTYEPSPTIKCPPFQTEPTLTKELEQTLDQLIKGINDFNKEIDKM